MAAAAADLKKVTLELGGKSPIVVFDDCDIDDAVSAALAGNFYSTGRVCSNGTRVFVQDGIFDEFVTRAVERTKASRWETPSTQKPKWTFGVRAATRARRGFLDSTQQDDSIDILCGGKRVEDES